MTDARLQVPMVTDEAEAVLQILDARAEGRTPEESDWKRLFATEGYRRLKERESSLKRPFEDSAFREFVLSAELIARAPALHETLRAWTRVDPANAARRAFAYLPDAAVIRAKVYSVIKPRTNSFVFDLRSDPAIFLYLDPKVTPDKLENTVTHELHHIGVASACPEDEDERLPENTKTALGWMSGFAEGRAVLAAAGGPDVHPHATSDAGERAVWDRDVAQLRRDFERLESFFNALLDGKLDEKKRNEQGMAFVSTEDVPQGAYYTVGWTMASAVERRFGRERLVESLCDPATFLTDYNRAAADADFPRWSDALLERIRHP
jgi:hypothetical protein